MKERTLGDRLHSAAIRVLRQVRTADAEAGMSAARLSALSVLVFDGATTVTELARLEQVTAPTMTRLLQGLEREGLVRRRRDRGDARVVQVTATAAGRKALEAARRRRVELLDARLRELTRTERVLLTDAVAVLERLTGAVSP